MKTGEKGNLGKGLSALMGNLTLHKEEQVDMHSKIQEVFIEQIVTNVDQPRKHFDAKTLKELAASIKEKGILSPILVRKKDDKLEIIAGERRYRAAQFANLDKVPVIVKEVQDSGAFEIALIENIQRQDLNIIEEANAYKSLLEKHSYNHKDISEITGKSRSHITNILRLLTLPQKVIDLLMYDAISMGHARALVGVPNAEYLAKRIVEHGLSVRQIESIVNAKPKSKSSMMNVTTSSNIDEDLKAIESLLSQKLYTTVSIKQKDASAGSIMLEYKSLGELDKILQLLSRA